MNENEKIIVTQNIKNSNYLVVFYGARIFTGSGIDDFKIADVFLKVRIGLFLTDLLKIIKSYYLFKLKLYSFSFFDFPMFFSY